MDSPRVTVKDESDTPQHSSYTYSDPEKFHLQAHHQRSGVMAEANCAASGRRADGRRDQNKLCIVSEDAWTRKDKNNKQIHEGIS